MWQYTWVCKKHGSVQAIKALTLLLTFVWVQGVPTNKLHEQGYVSIGCEPCTKAVLPNQLEREGRWWWEVRRPTSLPC